MTRRSSSPRPKYESRLSPPNQVTAQFSQMPTLGEFIAQAAKYGFSKRQITLEGPQGTSRIRYLWRDDRRFAPLPDLRDSDRLTRITVESLCAQLGIPRDDFPLEEANP